MKPEQQAKFQAAADKMIDDNITASSTRRRTKRIEFFKKEGKKVYAPDLDCLPVVRAEEICREIRQRLAEGRARAHQRGQVTRGCDGVTSAVASRRPVSCAERHSDGRRRLRRHHDIRGFGRARPMAAQASGERRRRAASTMFACFIIQIFFRYVLNNPGRLDRRGHRHDLALDACCGARRSFSAKQKKSASTSSIRTFPRMRGASSRSSPAARLVFLYGISLPASYKYVSFMKVERSAYLHVPIN